MDIDLPSLLVFRHLATCGSFTQTGKYWNISQPTVSQMVNRLEATTGLILLNRAGAKTSLTIDGQSFLERADEVCNHYLSLIDRMDERGRRIDREVKIGMDRSWFSSIALSAKAKFNIPEGITPVYTEIVGDGFAALESGQVDVTLACRFLHTAPPPGVQEALIRREKGITIAWKPEFHNLKHSNFSFPDILRTSVLIPGSAQFEHFETALKAWCQHAYGMLPANIETFPSEVDAASAALAGLGVFIAPGDAIPRLGIDAYGLEHFKTFDFLLPEALTLGVYCRSDEIDRDVLNTAAQVGRLCMKLFSDSADNSPRPERPTQAQA